MAELLESVQTEKLQNAYEKYLPAVLNNSTLAAKPVLTESRVELTGNRTVKAGAETDNTDMHNNVVELKRLAGLR